jgi:hypothetical protein
MYEKPLKKLLAHIYQSPRGQATISQEILAILSVHHHDVQEKHASTIAWLYEQVSLSDIQARSSPAVQKLCTFLVHNYPEQSSALSNILAPFQTSPCQQPNFRPSLLQQQHPVRVEVAGGRHDNDFEDYR